MTKSILLFATCGLILGGCSKTDVNKSDPSKDLNAISFTATTTRAAINDLTALQDGTTGGFHVYGSNNAIANAWHANVSGAEYKYNAPTWEWASTPAVWPTDPTHYPMSFYGHHPKTASGFTPTATPPSVAAGSSSLKGAITIQGTGTNQIDFLGATNTTSTKPPTGKLAMVFNHITSKINFGIITGTGVTAYVNKVDINALVNSGTYDYGTATWNLGTSGTAANYDYFSGAGSTAADFSNTLTTLNLKSPIYGTAAHSNHLMLMPQNATPIWGGTITGVDADGNAEGVTGAYIGMLYRLETAIPSDVDAVGYKVRGNCTTDTDWVAGPENDMYNSSTGTYVGPLYVKVGFPIGTTPLTWEKGKGYAYNMKLGTTDATGGLYLSKYYYDEDGNNTKIPVKGNPNITDPVAGGNIHFDVDVDAWEADTETNI